MFTFAISSSSSNCQYLFPEVQISFLCFSIYIIKAFKKSLYSIKGHSLYHGPSIPRRCILFHPIFGPLFSNHTRLLAVFLRPLPVSSLLGTISLSSRPNSRGWGWSSVGQMLAWHAPHIPSMLVHAYTPSTRELEVRKSEVRDKPQFDEFEASLGCSEALSQKGKKGGGKE